MTSILIDARLGWGSGIGRYVANTVPLVAQRMPGVRFDILVGGDDYSAARDVAALSANVRPVVSALRAFSFAEQAQLPRLAKAYDLTWFTNYWVPLMLRTPYVAVVHDMIHLEPAMFPASWLKRTASRLSFLRLKTAQALCFGSRFSQREYERRFAAHPRSVVTSYGIDHAGWPLFDPAAPPEKLPRLLIVAAAKQHKNFRMAVDAFAQANIAPHWRLTLITPDDKLRSSIDLADFARNSDKVDFRQGVSNDALRDIYGETAILLMPSLYEGFGLPLAEGLQAGASCISSTAQSLVELGQGAHVTWVNGLDLPGWIKAIEAECARFDAGGVARAERAHNMRHALSFSWADVAQKTATVLREALDQPAR